MVEIAELLIGTFKLRPYVFVFLTVYFIGASYHLGIKRALFYVPCGYFIAWLSEFSSIHTGVPYGMYRYIEATKGRELWVFGVPFMDSLSYVFLSYAAYSLVRFASGCFVPKNRCWYSTWPGTSVLITIYGSCCFVFLDLIIDPVALRGDRWFLGKIYEYPCEGVYFGVPMSNFAGWFLVGSVLVRILQSLDPLESVVKIEGVRSYALLTGPLLYFSVLAFNIAVTAWLGEKLLLVVDLILVLLLIFFLVFSVLTTRRAFLAVPPAGKP
ncbi:carotenoid biosynthesis protein [Thermodesulforhabdus norvegica]|uniref:Putative membrane protein n=1 Tax=Thermodesulforhabdus norvegica TaxID=39841 RepID=A0A1I4RAE2_9BACT|nr:carotenoid biosynthesis protein [Thermodesulforhabdus norvegica]SFM48883.1 putative membrane protein [Thermodesulforhabdus norvegica]